VEVDVQQREHEPQVGRDRRLPRQQRLDLVLDVQVEPVDVVVERDHVVGELDVTLGQRVQRPAECAQDERALLLQSGLELVELFLEGDSHVLAASQTDPSRNPRCACPPGP
jgi:hypothetical protein